MARAAQALPAGQVGARHSIQLPIDYSKLQGAETKTRPSAIITPLEDSKGGNEVCSIF
jgi:hypothetical protein